MTQSQNMSASADLALSQKVSGGPTRLETATWLFKNSGGVRAMWGVAVLARLLGQGLIICILLVAGHAVWSKSLLPALWWVLGLSMVKAGLRYLEHFAGHWVAFTMLTRLRTDFFYALAPGAPAATKGRAGAELSDRATRDIDRVEVFFAHTVPPAVSAVILPVCAVVYSWVALGTSVALIVLLGSVLLIAIPLLSVKNAALDNHRFAVANAGIATHLGDSVQGLREIRVFHAEDLRLREAASLDDALEAARQPIRRRAAVRAGMLVAVELGILIVLVAFNPFALLVWIGLWGSLRGIDDFVDGLDEALASAVRVREVMEASPLVKDGPNSAPSRVEQKAMDRRMALEGVTFGYDPGRSVLNDVSLEVRPGEWNFLVGISGSGKSTIAALFARGWDPQQGIVVSGGKNVKDMRLRDLRRENALVVQRPTIIRGSVLENLRLCDEHASEDDVRDALWMVGLEDWSDRLGQEISVDGTNISGGQVSRVAVARALAANPSCLILDEATSQLDSVTAGLMRDRIRERRPGLTVLEVTHQVDHLLPEANTIVVDAGRVVEQGTAGRLRENPDGPLSRLLRRVYAES